MRLSRLAIAAVVSLRAVLIYGEAPAATAAELTWRDALPLPRLRATAPSAAGLSSPVARV